MKKTIVKKTILYVLSTILILSMAFVAVGCTVDDKDVLANEAAIKYPIDKVTLDNDYLAVNIGASLSLNATYSPLYTDDVILWESSDTSIATVKNGQVKAVGVGRAEIKVRAKNGPANDTFAIMVMPIYSNAVAQATCMTTLATAVVTIENYCYNKNILGGEIDYKLNTFSGIIVKKESGNLTIVSNQESFALIAGCQYQRWTLIDAEGNIYSIPNYYYETNNSITDKNAVEITIWNNNLSYLPIDTPKGMYYKGETLYISHKNNFYTGKLTKTQSGASTMESGIPFNKNLMGSPVLDSNFNLVGIVSGESDSGKCLFTPRVRLNDFINRLRS